MTFAVRMAIAMTGAAGVENFREEFGDLVRVGQGAAEEPRGETRA
ncbi:hypothetical protein [Rhodococcus spelaei]|nr:hypothetical protein [Rhodococcus spelaei]